MVEDEYVYVETPLYEMRIIIHFIQFYLDMCKVFCNFNLLNNRLLCYKIKVKSGSASMPVCTT